MDAMNERLLTDAEIDLIELIHYLSTARDADENIVALKGADGEEIFVSMYLHCGISLTDNSYLGRFVRPPIDDGQCEWYPFAGTVEDVYRMVEELTEFEKRKRVSRPAAIRRF